MRRLYIFVLAGACAVGISCTSARQPPPSGAGTCPLVVSFPDAKYQNAGTMVPFFGPMSLDEIDVFQGDRKSFLIRNVADGSLSPQRASEKVPFGSLFVAYPLRFGLPTAAWEEVAHWVDENRYEIHPGVYQLIVRYRSKKNPRVICVTASEPIEVLGASVAVVTDELQR